MYKIVTNEAPLCLSDLLPRRVAAASNYNLRNSQKFEIPFTSLCSFETSFFPSTIRLWNNLDNPTRNATSLLQFKRSLRHPPCKPHAFMTSQHRKQDVILTRLQHNCSSLNEDLFRVNIVNNPRCDCGYAVEDACHFFYDCSLYNNQRNHLNVSLITSNVTDLNMLLNGNSNLDNNINSSIQETVLKYIKDTHRFT